MQKYLTKIFCNVVNLVLCSQCAALQDPTSKLNKINEYENDMIELVKRISGEERKKV